jgi:hypothetical protein
VAVPNLTVLCEQLTLVLCRPSQHARLHNLWQPWGCQQRTACGVATDCGKALVEPCSSKVQMALTVPRREQLRLPSQPQLHVEPHRGLHSSCMRERIRK